MSRGSSSNNMLNFAFRLMATMAAIRSSIATGLNVGSSVTATVLGNQVSFQGLSDGVNAIGSPVNGTFYRQSPYSAAIVTASGDEYTLSVDGQNIAWQQNNASEVSSQDLLLSGSNIRATLYTPENQPIPTSIFSNIFNSSNFILNLGSHPNDLEQATEVNIDSSNILGTTIGDDAHLEIVGVGVNSDDTIQVRAPGNFQPSNSTIVSANPVSYAPIDGSVFVNQNGRESLISSYPGGVEVSEVIPYEVAGDYQTILSGSRGNLSISSSHPIEIQSHQQQNNTRRANFAQLRPIDLGNGPQIDVPSDIGYAVIDTQGDQDVKIYPQSNSENLVIGYKGSTDNSILDVTVGSQLFLVANLDMANFVNRGSFVSHPVSGNNVIIDGSQRSLDDLAIEQDYFPVITQPNGLHYGFTGASFNDLVQVAQNSITGATRTSPTLTTAPARVPETTADHDITQGSDHQIDNDAIIGVIGGIFLVGAALGIAANQVRRRNENARAQDTQLNPLYERPELDVGFPEDRGGWAEDDIFDLMRTGLTPEDGQELDDNGYMFVESDSDIDFSDTESVQDLPVPTQEPSAVQRTEPSTAVLHPTGKRLGKREVLIQIESLY